MVRDRVGDLYGTTPVGGTFGWGTVFVIDASGALTILHNFAGPPHDGQQPEGGLVLDGKGNLYGVTAWGGSGTNCFAGATSGCGTIFKLTTTGKEHVLHSFAGEPDGSYPTGVLLRDAVGNLYGVASGGAYNQGAVFELSSDGNETVLYSFTGGTDGGSPNGGLVQDAAGNLYGATYYGGTLYDGTVFELNSTGQESVLHAFSGPPDGSGPEGPLTWGLDGNLYGVTNTGGVASCIFGGCGTVFKVSLTGEERVIYKFVGGLSDGAAPTGGLIADGGGNLYGTTFTGGIAPCFSYGCGTVFKLNRSGQETVIHFFAGPPDGEDAQAGLVRDQKGNLYGTTLFGGDASCPTYHYPGCGIVFELSPQ